MFTFSHFLMLMIRSRPLKAPEATNRMLVVSTWTVSPLSFLEFFSGTLMIVPSRSLSRPYQTEDIIRHTQCTIPQCFLNLFSTSSKHINVFAPEEILSLPLLILEHLCPSHFWAIKRVQSKYCEERQQPRWWKGNEGIYHMVLNMFYLFFTFDLTQSIF